MCYIFSEKYNLNCLAALEIQVEEGYKKGIYGKGISAGFKEVTVWPNETTRNRKIDDLYYARRNSNILIPPILIALTIACFAPKILSALIVLAVIGIVGYPTSPFRKFAALEDEFIAQKVSVLKTLEKITASTNNTNAVD